MSTPNTSPTPSPAGSLESRLSSCEHELHAAAAKLQRGAALTLVIGVALVALLAGYFWYGYHEISSVLNHDTLLAAGETWLENQLPEVRRSLEAEVDRSAPVWAASLSKQAQDSLPTLRSKLEEHVMQQIDTTVDQTVEVTEAQFRQFLRENRAMLTQGFEDLRTSPALADESIERVAHAFEVQFEVDMKKEARDLFTTLGQLKTKLNRLKDGGASLQPDEQLERRILMLARRLQLEKMEAGISTASAELRPVPAVTTPGAAAADDR
jgi:hypothetical protein